MPKVSVIIPSYNHEKYIAYALESVLGQTFQDFEIIINDDHSSDKTVEEIKKFKDPRIKLFISTKNHGVCVAINNCLVLAKGKYIAHLNSDDAFFPEKLEKQVAYLDAHPETGAVFTQAQMIDEGGSNIPDSEHFHGKMNSLENRNRFQWLNYFFYNCRWLWHPSMMMRKKVYDFIGYHNPCLAQIQDFDIGIRLSLKYEQHIIQEKLTKFRIRAGEMNASAATPKAVVRSMFEFSHVLKHYLKIMNIGEFIKIFPLSQEKYCDITDDELIPFYVARQTLEVEHVFHQKFALDVLFDLLQNKKIVSKLNKQSKFDYADFIELTGKYDIYHVNHITYQDDLIKKLKGEIIRLKKPINRIRMAVNEIINK
ncbi:MAG: glycosyltransferase [Patescibacteria group bacterium]